MTLKDDLAAEVSSLARTRWDDIPQGKAVPDTTDSRLTHSNTGIYIDGTVLYADLDGSTKMVDSLDATRSAEYYKAYLHCAAKIVKDDGGSITAYDGDRIMAIFIGDTQATDAIRSAFKINWAIENIVNPGFLAIYGEYHRQLRHTIGIDSGRLLASKIGIRRDADMVWVGPAANYAAKLNSFEGLDSDYPVRITTRTHARLNGQFQLTKSGGAVWDGPYNNLGEVKHYRSSCTFLMD